MAYKEISCGTMALTTIDIGIRPITKNDIISQSTLNELKEVANALRLTMQAIPIHKKERCVNCGATKINNVECEYCGT